MRHPLNQGPSPWRGAFFLVLAQVASTACAFDPGTTAASPSARVSVVSATPAGVAQLVCDSVTPMARAIEQALKSQGAVRLSAGTCLLEKTLELPAKSSLQGAGAGVTVLRLQPGVNDDALRSERFAELAGKKAFSDAPSDIVVKDLTVDGGYLRDSWKASANETLNSRGSCVRLYAWRVRLDVTAQNCAEHLFYSEAQGPRPPEETASVYRITGHLAGKECIVFRGPGDSVFEHVGAGLCGVLPRPRALKERPSSTLFGGQATVDGMVLDATAPYEGTAEVGYAHLYATFAGWAVRTRGAVRFKAQHLVAESSTGGVLLDAPSWGAVSLLDVHANGKSYPGTQLSAPLAGLRIESVKGFAVSQATVARTVGSGEGWPALELTGAYSRVSATVLNSRNPDTGKDFGGPALRIEGKGHDVSLLAPRVSGPVLQGKPTSSRLSVQADGPQVLPEGLPASNQVQWLDTR